MPDIEHLVDQRLTALLDKDWERYNNLGWRILEHLEARERLMGRAENEPIGRATEGMRDVRREFY